MRIPRFRERPLHPVSRRFNVWWRRVAMRRFVRQKRVRLVRMGGRAYKVVTFPDSAIAAEIEQNLVAVERYGLFPPLAARFDRELVLEFVEGEVVPRPPVEGLARFFGTLYAHDRRRVPIEETDALPELHRSLRFLHRVGVLGEPAWKDLDAAADALAPESVWVGWDYLDPNARNFVLSTDGRLVAVDVENVAPDQVLGWGVAKACLRGGAPRDALIAAVEREGRLELFENMPFVELDFLARWTARAYLKGIEKLVDPARFEPYRKLRA